MTAVTIGGGLTTPVVVGLGHADTEGSTWKRDYVRLLVIMDLLCVLLGTTAAGLIRFSTDRAASVSGLPYLLLSVVAVPVWMGMVALHRCYEPRLVSSGAGAFRRVFLGSARLGALVAIVCYVGKIGLARGYVAMAMPTGIALLLAGRYAVRQIVRSRRRKGEFNHRVLLVGGPLHTSELAAVLRRD